MTEMMRSMIEGTISGSIGALVAAAILSYVVFTRDWLAERRDVRYIRDLLIGGRKRVMEAKDTSPKTMGVTISADTLRAAQYNNMIKQLGIALEKWLVNLSHDKRKDIFDALDWYHTDGLQAIKKNKKAEFVELPDGKWVPMEMPIEVAKEKFENLQSIEWLKLEPY